MLGNEVVLQASAARMRSLLTAGLSTFHSLQREPPASSYAFSEKAQGRMVLLTESETNPQFYCLIDLPGMTR